MAFCKNCGTRLDNEAKFCPNCGTSTSAGNANVSDDEKYLELIKINYDAAIIAYKQDKKCDENTAEEHILDIMNKHQDEFIDKEENTQSSGGNSGCFKKVILGIVKVFAVFLVVGIIGIMLDDNKDTQKTEQTEKEQVKVNATEQIKKEQVEESQSAEKSIIGTYEVTDKIGCTIHITFNNDKTATITGVKGEGITYYCTWDDYTDLNAGFEIAFSDEKPYLVYEGGADEVNNSIFLNDGWLYSNYNNSKAKNPRWRLKVTKIK